MISRGTHNYDGGTLSPLWPPLHRGMIAITVLAIVSFIATTTLFLYLTVKFISWYLFVGKQHRLHGTSTIDEESQTAKTLQSQSSDTHELQELHPSSQPKSNDFVLGIDGIFNDTSSSHHNGPPSISVNHDTCQDSIRSTTGAPNQFLVLIYNLLLADILQSAAFSLNAAWLIQNGIMVDTATCFTQGLLVSVGDLASSVFITAVAIHSYLSIVKGYQPRDKVLYFVIFGLWSFILLMSTLPVAATRNGAAHGGFFVRAVAWCWMNSEYTTLRLVTHYMYLFVGLFTTSIIYTAIYIHLCRKAAFEEKDASNIDGYKARSRNNYAFLVYPIIYVSCTLPVAIGRILTMANVPVPLEYFCFAGALIAFNGFFDVLLYSTTRNTIIFSAAHQVGMSDTGVDTFRFLKTPSTRQYGNMIWIQGGDRKRRSDEKRSTGFWSSSWQRLAGGRPNAARENSNNDNNNKNKGNKGKKRANDRESTEVLQRQMSKSDGIMLDLVTSVTIERDNGNGRPFPALSFTGNPMQPSHFRAI